MGGWATSFRLRPGYVPHTGTRTQVCMGEVKQGERRMDRDTEEEDMSVCRMEYVYGVVETLYETVGKR